TVWAGMAREVLVGIAKRDGVWWTEVLLGYLEPQPLRERAEIDAVLYRLRALLTERRRQTMDIESLRTLEAIEKEQGGTHDCIGEFKFSSNEKMVELVQRRRASSSAPAVR
ncbi:MAG: hypothetical protein ACREIH_09360, partial [Nitrospiraceae bacterium]